MKRLLSTLQRRIAVALVLLLTAGAVMAIVPDPKKRKTVTTTTKTTTQKSSTTQSKPSGTAAKKTTTTTKSSGATKKPSGTTERKSSTTTQQPTTTQQKPSTPVESRESARKRILNNLVANMVRVEGGTFTMGGTSEQGSDAYDWEKPTHQVTLSSYYIGKYEVTQEEWEAVMGSNPSCFKGAKLPVEQVSWEDCMDFIMQLNSLTGKRFRLPTEAEWEFAARGGRNSQGLKYAGGYSMDAVGWFTDNSAGKTHPVGQKRANELGLYDMSGNVWEWCQDWYGSYSSSSQTNPTGPSTGSGRVLRGGSWNNLARGCRVSLRNDPAPSNRDYYLGLRLACSAL